VKWLLTIGSILLCLALPARAQDAVSTPFDGELQRLAEILGSLQYLRTVCAANEGQKWRNEMQALIDAEAPGGERRRKIIASFNRGYRGYQQTYRTCTPAADVAIRRYTRISPAVINLSLMSGLCHLPPHANVRLGNWDWCPTQDARGRR
jgi:uncharacterized protein (TIGR02301 family)